MAIPNYQVATAEFDSRRGSTALTIHMGAHLRQAVIRQQNQQEQHRVDLAPFSLGTWSTFLQLRKMPQLRMEAGFPRTHRWLEGMSEVSTFLIGQTCMQINMSYTLGLSIQERSDAAQDRSYIITELNSLPTWLECRMELLTPILRNMVETYLNASSEMFWAMTKILNDSSLVQVSQRCAEAVVRCRLRRPPRSEVTTTPLIRAARPTTISADSRVRMGFYPHPNPNLALTFGLVSTAAPSPYGGTAGPSTTGSGLAHTTSATPIPTPADGVASSDSDFEIDEE